LQRGRLSISGGLGRLSISGGLGRLSISGGLGSKSYRNEAVCLISGGLGWPFVYLRWFRLRELRGRLSMSGGLDQRATGRIRLEASNTDKFRLEPTGYTNSLQQLVTTARGAPSCNLLQQFASSCNSLQLAATARGAPIPKV
jgi:hypothetical protein